MSVVVRVEKLATKSIDTDQIADGAVKAPKLLLPTAKTIHEDSTVHRITSTSYTTVHSFSRPEGYLNNVFVQWSARTTGTATAYVRLLGYIKLGGQTAYYTNEASTTSTTAVTLYTYNTYTFFYQSGTNLYLQVATSNATVPAEVSYERVEVYEAKGAGE